MRNHDERHRDEPTPSSPGNAAPGKVPATARIARMVMRDGAGTPTADADAAVERAGASSGAPLPADVRARFEGSLGADLSAVRVHTGSASAEATRAVGARAYALGNDIHFADGQYRPTDAFGIHLLAHEVAHTVQQSGGAPAPQYKLEVSQPGDAAELEADRAAEAMVRGEPASVTTAPLGASRVVQRWKPTDGVPGLVDIYKTIEEATKGTPDVGDIDLSKFRVPKTGFDPYGSDPRLRAQLGAQFWDYGAPPVDLDAEPPPPWTEPAPAPTRRLFGVDDYVAKFQGDWTKTQEVWSTMISVRNNYRQAGDRAAELGIQRDVARSTTQGWNAPKGEHLDLDKYAEQQGARRGPSLGDMFKGGSIDPSYQKFASDDWSKDTPFEKALIARRQAQTDLAGVLTSAADEMPGKIDGEVAKVNDAALDVDQANLDKDEAKAKVQRGDIDRESAQFNARLKVVTSGVGLITAALKRDAGVVQAAGDMVSSIANLHFGDKLRDLDAKIEGIKYQGSELHVRKALNKKELALATMRVAVAGIKNDIQARINGKYEAFKAAHETATREFRNAAEARAKKEKKAPDDVKAEGAQAEALMRSLSAIEFVVASAKAGSDSCTPPTCTPESAAGAGILDAGERLASKVGVLHGTQAAFQQVQKKWEGRLNEVKAILNTHAT
jgi:hypothetical protein